MLSTSLVATHARYCDATLGRICGRHSAQASDGCCLTLWWLCACGGPKSRPPDGPKIKHAYALRTVPFSVIMLVVRGCGFYVAVGSVIPRVRARRLCRTFWSCRVPSRPNQSLVRSYTMSPPCCTWAFRNATHSHWWVCQHTWHHAMCAISTRPVSVVFPHRVTALVYLCVSHTLVYVV